MKKISKGQVFNSFTTIRPEKLGHRSGWLCRCECGVEKVVYSQKLTSGLYKSCGCKRAENISKAVTRHGMTSRGNMPSEYSVWRGIKTRCLNPKTRHYSRYGGRGIKICDEWKNDFEAFYKSVGPRPSKHHTIDRIDNDGDYEPSNVRWATSMQQGRNKSTNVMVEMNGRMVTLAEVSQETGIGYSTLYYRLKNGLPILG